MAPIPKRLAEQVADQPQFLAATVLAYQRQHGLSDEAMAAHFQISLYDLARLILSQRPQAGSRMEDVAAIARDVGCDEPLIWRLLQTPPER